MKCYLSKFWMNKKCKWLKINYFTVSYYKTDIHVCMPLYVCLASLYFIGKNLISTILTLLSIYNCFIYMYTVFWLHFGLGNIAPSTNTLFEYMYFMMTYQHAIGYVGRRGG